MSPFRWTPRTPKKQEATPMPTQPLMSTPIQPSTATVVPSPVTMDAAKSQGLAVSGTMMAAPLAPKSGQIPGESGSLVVTVVKNFWESPTIKAIRNVVIGAVGLAFFGVAAQIMAVNGDLMQVNWQTTEKIAIGTIAFSLASAYAAWWKTRDNDPVK